MRHLYTAIKSADIFYAGADVIRRGSLALPAGTHTICVHGLTKTCVTDTARIYGEEGVRCVNMRLLANSRQDTGELEELPEEEAGILAGIKKLEEEIAGLNRKIEVKQLQAQLWKTNGDFTGRNVQAVGEVENYIEKLPERVLALQEEIRTLENEIEKLGRKKQEAEEAANLPCAMVDTIVEKEGTYFFELRYHEPSVSWKSFYEIHSTGEEPLEMRHRAKINQYTQEDWKEVKLRLYTGNPSGGDVLPRISPVYLDYPAPVQPNMMLMGGMGMAQSMMAQASAGAMPAARGMMAMDDAAAPPEPVFQRMETEEAEVKSEDSMTEYIIQGTKDIPKGGDGILADLQVHIVPADYRVEAIPKENTRAFVVAYVRYGDMPFTEKTGITIYRDGVYSGSFTLTLDEGEEWQNITLGTEDRIRISRKSVSKKTSTTLLKGQKVVAYLYETKVTNIAGKEMVVILRDQIPVSQNKEITVETTELSGAKLDAETGILTSEVRVPAGESRTLKLAYKVLYPKDKTIREIKDAKMRQGWCPTCGAKLTGARFCPECGAKVR